MRKPGGFVALVVASFFVVGTVLAEEVSSSSSRPPRNLKKVGDHWTPWDPPEPGPGAYIIQKGDTLWDLAQQWLGNPFLWPQIWDLNRYILDSHWIYPGDPLMVPGQPTVVPPEGPPPGAAPGEEAAVPPVPFSPPAAEKRPAISPVRLFPLATEQEVRCAGYIDPDHVSSELWVAGREFERYGVATGDVIYLNQGRNQGIEAGMDLAVLRKTYDIAHPATDETMGNMMRRLGKARVLCAQENTATAVIEQACDDIGDNDELVPWTELPVPAVSTMPPMDRCIEPSGGAQGYVVATKDDVRVAATGQIIHTDLGAGTVRPGDFLTVYRDNAELPRLLIGQALILTVEPGSSTAKVTRSVRELGIGDRVEVVR